MLASILVREKQRGIRKRYTHTHTHTHGGSERRE